MSKKFLLTGLWTLVALTALSFGAVKANELRNEGGDVSVSGSIDQGDTSECTAGTQINQGCRKNGCANGYKSVLICTGISGYRQTCVQDSACQLTPSAGSSSTTGTSTTGEPTTGGQETTQPNVPTTGAAPTCSPVAPGKIYFDNAKVQGLTLSSDSTANITWFSNGGWGSRCSSKIRKQYTIRATLANSTGKCIAKPDKYTLITTQLESKLTTTKFNNSLNKVTFARKNDSAFTFETGKTYCLQVTRSNGGASKTTNTLIVKL